jgi:hypothetical protein
VFHEKEKNRSDNDDDAQNEIDPFHFLPLRIDARTGWILATKNNSLGSEMQAISGSFYFDLNSLPLN